ncbi:hypothetical protein BCR43DRAFT_76767 [Syncephalastrum racemosum]|uniref:Uncharacterized protein n=1 Tax=Syncephalastrum racemosum TaxID=13706 RepID=A0A1X2H2G0_SYNRA|nr:hypothetical protein BCR43DRAFT_76767 [Syncephalastrum racemosum]
MSNLYSNNVSSHVIILTSARSGCIPSFKALMATSTVSENLMRNHTLELARTCDGRHVPTVSQATNRVTTLFLGGQWRHTLCIHERCLISMSESNEVEELIARSSQQCYFCWRRYDYMNYRRHLLIIFAGRMPVRSLDVGFRDQQTKRPLRLHDKACARRKSPFSRTPRRYGFLNVRLLPTTVCKKADHWLSHLELPCHVKHPP